MPKSKHKIDYNGKQIADLTDKELKSAWKYSQRMKKVISDLSGVDGYFEFSHALFKEFYERGMSLP